jgi:hypothetical protein
MRADSPSVTGEISTRTPEKQYHPTCRNPEDERLKSLVLLMLIMLEIRLPRSHKLGY